MKRLSTKHQSTIGKGNETSFVDSFVAFDFLSV